MIRQVLTLIFLLFAAGHAIQAQDEERALTKNTIFLKFHSAITARDHAMVVMLPPGYDDHPEKRYPVLYMHDGQQVFVVWRLDELGKTLVEAGQASPIIIVAIYNGDTQESRIEDYTPTRLARAAKSGNADRYGRLIREEIKPVIDKEFRTLPDPANTAIGGASLGGLVSMYLALKNPETFGKAAVMSPSVWWDDQVIVREVKKLSTKPSLRIWLDVGTEEGNQRIPETKALRDALIKKGWQIDSDLKYFEARGAEHNDKAFARRAPEMLKFLFPATAVTPAVQP
jgi:predicted alpha/beta superfamily hydrolase